MNWHRIDFKRLVVLLLPPGCRIKVLIALLHSAIRPLQSLYLQFVEFKGTTDYRLKYNAQMCHLRAVLNDEFDTDLRRIEILDATRAEWGELLYPEAADRCIMLGVFILQREAFIGSNSLDFVVNVPKILNLSDSEINRMETILRYYQLASKRYTIEFF